MKKLLLTLCLLLTATFLAKSQAQETSAEWTSFVRSIDVSFLSKELKFRLTAKAKVNSEDENSFAGLWVRVDNKDGETGFFDNMGDRPIKATEWESYRIEGVINDKSDRLFFGGLCLYNGQFYFDDFKLEIEDKNGEFQIVEMENADFSAKVLNNRIQAWTEGIDDSKPKRIKEYSISSYKDEGSNNLALLVEGKGIEKDTSSYYIGPLKGYSQQVGTIITMLNNLSDRVERVVASLDERETDWLLDDNANSIGALIMHLAAAEAYYQVFTFEGRGFNDEEKEKWQTALSLGKEAQEKFKGKSIQHYLDIYKKVREKTIEELGKRDDEWLLTVPPNAGISNYFSWFHVMEHQSSHLGQVLLLKKRIPKIEAKIELEKN
ncbi:MAG: DUF664 domain-containing protein [Roseivirga sp.]|nr:DUF664 domain-containing protein [Roseivirga sp.]